MTARLTLIVVPPLDDRRALAFPGRDRRVLPFDSLPDGVRNWLSSADRLFCAPEIAIESGTLAIRFDAGDALAEVDYGAWAGRVMNEIVERDPEGFTLWRRDMAAVPHGGESLIAVRARLTSWLVSLEKGSMAMVSATIARVLVAAAVDLPLPVIWQLDPQPWAAVELTRYRGRWSLRLG